MTATEVLVTRGGRAGRPAKPARRHTPHKGAIAIFAGPFGVLFLLFYLIPIGYAVWQSLLVVQRDGTYGTPEEVFGGLTQYALVFQNAPFWESVGRVLVFGVVQVPIMLGLALLFALLLDSPALITVFLFQFVSIWNNFFLPLIMLRSQELFPVTFGLYSWNTQLNQIPELRTYVLVGSFLSIVPLIVAFLLLQRFWRNGLGTGSVK